MQIEKPITPCHSCPFTLCTADSPAEHARVLVPQVWRQMEAENVDEFKQAVAMQQMPMFTYIYSSHEGDTFYQSNSWTPDYSGMPVAYDWAVA